jgi:acetamidase/formamidase
MKTSRVFLGASIALLAAHPLQAAPKTHRLEVTPGTVAYGYYWSDAQPVLRIASGDIVDVDTLLTNTPEGLRRAGVAEEKIQASLRTVVEEVTGERRGPGGHILTGPIYVEGAQPGDVLEVNVLSIDLALDYGYNGCSGFLPDNCDKSLPAKIIELDRDSAAAVFRQHGRRAGRGRRSRQQQSARPSRRQSRQS